jgi:tetratricopeptide (TPR) repeat protein
MSDELIIKDLVGEDLNTQLNSDDLYTCANIKYYELQDVEGALADYDRAIELNPNHALAYSNRGNVKKDRLQDYRGALSGVAIRLRSRSFSGS